MFSIRCRALYKSLLYSRGLVRLRLGGITAVLPCCWSRSITRSSASYPLSATSVSVASSLSRTSAPARSQEEFRSQMKPYSIAESIDQGMNLGIQSTFAATNGFARCIPPLAPALCWWARTIVESIMAYSLSASLANCSNTRCHTPRFAHRLNRV